MLDVAPTLRRAPHAETVAKPEAPLLPPLLCGPAALLWLWALPLTLLLVLNVQGYWLVEGNMSPEQRTRAWLIGAGNVANILVACVLYGVAWRQRARGKTPFTARELGGAPALVVQVAFLGLVFGVGSDVLPRSVPAWIYPEGRFLFNQFAFAMVPLFLGALQLAALPVEKAAKATAASLVVGMIAPTLVYVAGHAVQRGSWAPALPAVILASLGIMCGLLVLLVLLHALLRGFRSLRALGGGGERMAIGVFALVLPMLGLAVNQTIDFPVSFQAWEVYALTTMNAAVLLLASFQHAGRPRLSFGLLSAAFPFSLYFFVVFLPYVPLGVFAILFFGAGLLMLTPTALFVLHVHLLYQAWRALPGSGAAKRRTTWCVGACVALLPLLFVGQVAADRVALQAAVQHVFAPPVAGDDIPLPAEREALRRALANHRAYKKGINYPLLSDFYGWMVFDNLVLPDAKEAQIERLVFGEGKTPNMSRATSGRQRSGPRPVAAVPRTVELQRLDVHARREGAATSTVTLVFNLRNIGGAQAEYVTELPLPAGVVVSGFRLHINGVPVPGRITEKKTAQWVYSMIRDRERRDPGMLTYTAPDQLELRVFPIEAGAKAIVEVDFLAPAEIAADDALLARRHPAGVLRELGRAGATALANTDAGPVLVPRAEALALPAVRRGRYLHVIVERSADNPFEGDLAKAVAELRRRIPEARFGRLSVVNHSVRGVVNALTPLDELATRATALVKHAVPAEGGLALDLAVAHGLRQHERRELDTDLSRAGPPPEPVFVVLSRTAGARAVNWELTEAWRDLVPGLEVHELGGDGTWTTHRTGPRDETAPLLRLGRSIRPALAGRPVVFATSGASAEAVVEYWSEHEAAWRTLQGVVRRPATEGWSRALGLQALHTAWARSPGSAPLDRGALVRASRESGIMLPGTSYIVVENAAQWRMLEVSERRKLGQADALEFVQTPAPGWVVMAAGFVLYLGVRRWREKRRA